jgi:hypothetical protein
MTEGKKEMEIVFRGELIVDYDESAHLLALPKLVKEVSTDIKKVKILKKGIERVPIVIVKLNPGLMHGEVKNVMFSKGITPAGLHELIIFSHFLDELFRDGMRIVSLRDEMFEMGVEFIPTICCHKKSAMIIMAFRDDLPFKETYFLGIEEARSPAFKPLVSKELKLVEHGTAKP